MHPSMQRYAGNPMMRYQSDENDDGYGPEQPHTYPGGDAQHPPIFVVPQEVRTRRPGPSRPIQLGQESGVPAAFLRNDLDGFSDIFERLAHGFPKKRPRPEPCNHDACRLKQHVPEFGLPFTALSPTTDDEQAWLQAKRQAERKRTAALEQEIEKDKAESVRNGAESFKNAWASEAAEAGAKAAEAAAEDEAAAALGFAQYYLKRLQDSITAPDEDKQAMTEQLVEEFAASVADRHAERVKDAADAQRKAAQQTALDWANAAREVEETKHDQRVAALHTTAEAAARQFADEWKQRRRNQEAARRAQLQESWKKKQEQQIAALRALRERQEQEKSQRRKQLEEAAEQLLAEQRRELEREAEKANASALRKRQEEAAARLQAAHQQELEQQRREHDRLAQETLASEQARQEAETERISALWRQAQEQREAEIRELNQHLHEQREGSPSACNCELPHPHSSHSTTPAATPPAGTPEAKPATDPPAPEELTPEQAQKQSLAKIADIRKAANKAAAEWRDGAFVPILQDKSNEKEVRHARHVFEEALLQEVLHLDLIDSDGNLEVRRARKQAIKDIEDCVSTLKEYSSFYDYKPDYKAKSVLLTEA